VTSQQKIINNQGGDPLACQAAWERVPSVQGNGLFPRQFLQIQGPMRHQRRGCAATRAHRRQSDHCLGISPKAVRVFGG